MISFREKDYMYSYNKMKPKPFSTHLHRYYEFLYFIKGDATYIVEGTEYKAQDGDLFITIPGEMHSIVFKSERDYEREFIQISEDLLPKADFDFLKFLREKPFGEKNKISAQLVDNSDIKRAFEKVRYYVENRLLQSDGVIKSCVVQLLDEVNRILPNEQENSETENERVVVAKRYINANLSKNLSLEKIAEASFTDKYYLSHIFRSETGITMTDYINIQRIALAKSLIGKGMNATEVYSLCGFNDYSSFYRAFKKLSGKSPSEFFHIKNG